MVIDSDVENQLRSDALKRRLQDKSLSHGSIEFYLKCSNLTAIGWGEQQPFSRCHSLLRVDLSGCPKLESIHVGTFAANSHLVSVVFDEYSNIANLGWGAFQNCLALTSITFPDKLEIIERLAFVDCSALERVVCNKKLKSIGKWSFQDCIALENITLPDKLKLIEELAFVDCTSLERVVCNKNLKTIGDAAFQGCVKLKDVQLASSSISFGGTLFLACDRMIELAAAAGFPSNTIIPVGGHLAGENLGAGVAP